MCTSFYFLCSRMLKSLPKTVKSLSSRNDDHGRQWYLMVFHVSSCSTIKYHDKVNVWTMVDHGRPLQTKKVGSLSTTVGHGQTLYNFCSPWLTMVNHALTLVNPDHFYPIMVDADHDGDLSLLTCVCCNGEHGHPWSLTMASHGI